MIHHLKGSINIIVGLINFSQYVVILKFDNLYSYISPINNRYIVYEGSTSNSGCNDEIESIINKVQM